MKKEIIRLMLISLGIILIPVVGYWLYSEYQTGIRLFLNPRASKVELLAHTCSHGTSAPILLVVLTAVMCAIPDTPTSVAGVIAGLSFGPLTGAIINILGNAFGSITAILLMHRLKFLDKKTETNHWVQAIRQVKHPKIDVILDYMIPAIPPSMVNFAAGVMKLPLQRIALSIAIGVVPSSALYACDGEAPSHGYSKTAIMLTTNVTVLVGLVVLIYKDRKKKQGKQKHR